MAGTELILCDTDILIEFFRNNESVAVQLSAIGEERIFISIVTVCELYYGALNKQELARIQRKLKGLVQIPVHDKICEVTEKLVETFCLSHRLSIPDAFIAGTALYYEIPLLTRNKKDFRFIPDLELYKLPEME
jgi:tRNA(fMet)-specific endonuclease VapC